MLAADEKSHEATQHRRRLAREQGHDPQTRELSSATCLLVAIASLALCGRRLTTTMVLVTERQLGGAWLSTDLPTVTAHFGQLAGILALCLLPFFAALLVTACVSNVAQVGLVFLPQ